MWLEERALIRVAQVGNGLRKNVVNLAGWFKPEMIRSSHVRSLCFSQLVRLTETVVFQREDIANPFVGELDMEIGVQEVLLYHRGQFRS